MKQNMQDLTEGSLGKKILIFSVPLMLSNLLQVLFNMADIAVIGQFAGSLSLGAVGSTATLVTMFTGFLIGLSGGINVLTALYYGAKDKDSLSKTIHSAALVSLIMGVLLLVLGVGLSEWMLTALKTKEELLDKAVLYLRIYYLGMPALAIYNFGNAVYSPWRNSNRRRSQMPGCSPVRMRSWNRHTAKCPTAVKLRKAWQRVIVSAAMMQKTVRGIP